MSKRRDHYVQEAYLKRFANENGLLYKYSKSSSSYDKRLFSQEKVCKKNKYYSSRLETDILANFIEPKGLNFIQLSLKAGGEIWVILQGFYQT
jgi:hypothetical protein